MTEKLRRCYLCKRELPLDRYLTITERKRRGERVYEYTKLSHDCRDCRAEQRRAERARKAQETGRIFVPRAKAQLDRETRKLGRRIAWALCLAFWKLVKLAPSERTARIVKRQRERRHSDPAYWAACKASKLRRTRAQRGTQVEPVSLQPSATAGRATSAAARSLDARGRWITWYR